MTMAAKDLNFQLNQLNCFFLSALKSPSLLTWHHFKNIIALCTLLDLQKHHSLMALRIFTVIDL
jgi:hypothetical protein